MAHTDIKIPGVTAPVRISHPDARVRALVAKEIKEGLYKTEFEELQLTPAERAEVRRKLASFRAKMARGVTPVTGRGRGRMEGHFDEVQYRRLVSEALQARKKAPAKASAPRRPGERPERNAVVDHAMDQGTEMIGKAILRLLRGYRVAMISRDITAKLTDWNAKTVSWKLQRMVAEGRLRRFRRQSQIFYTPASSPAGRAK